MIIEDRDNGPLWEAHRDKYQNEDWWGSPHEIWKDIPNVKGYQVSNLGRVRGKHRAIYNRNQTRGTKSRLHVKKAAPIKQASDRRASGEGGSHYKFVRLSVDGNIKKYYVHFLVVRAFIGKKPAAHWSVDHINRYRDDNRPENLRWATRIEQNQNRELSKMVRSGEDSNFAKLNYKKAEEIRRRYMGAGGALTYKDLGDIYGVSVGTIQRIMNNKIWVRDNNLEE